MAERRHPRNGISIRELAQRSGSSTASIIRWTSEPRADYEGRAAQRHERIRELREQGFSMRAIAAEVGVTVGAVHYALHKDERKSA